jgi:Rrf2 family protein
MRPDLTKRADYAIRAMISLARSGRDEPLSARRIASEMGIPVRFLPQVMSDLGRAGLVRSTPGRNGGHRLVRDPARIDLLEIIEAIEGDSRRRTCVLRGGPCNAAGQCDVHAVFFAAQEALRDALASADLAMVARRNGRAGPGPTALAPTALAPLAVGPDRLRPDPGQPGG